MALTDGPTTVLIDGTEVVDAATVSARLPDDLPPGNYGVELLMGPRVLASPTRLTVVDPTAESVCTSGLTHNTSVALAVGEIRIDRFDPAGDQTTVELPLQRVAAIEYEQAHTDDGVCSVIWIRRTDNVLVAFDHRDRSLEARAERLAHDIERPFSVTRLDEPVAADAAE